MDGFKAGDPKTPVRGIATTAMATLGIAKGQIILGHCVSEEPGMDECAKWLRTFITGIPIQFVPAGEPFWT